VLKTPYPSPLVLWFCQKVSHFGGVILKKRAGVMLKKRMKSGIVLSGVTHFATDIDMEVDPKCVTGLDQ
jgi:hypothetical protein